MYRAAYKVSMPNHLLPSKTERDNFCKLSMCPKAFRKASLKSSHKKLHLKLKSLRQNCDHLSEASVEMDRSSNETVDEIDFDFRG